jgi:hypothetical protein
MADCPSAVYNFDFNLNESTAGEDVSTDAEGIVEIRYQATT